MIQVISGLCKNTKKRVVRTVFYGVILSFFMLFGCASRSEKEYSLLQQARLIAWSEPDSAMTMISNIDTLRLNSHQRIVYRIVYNRIVARRERTPYSTAYIESQLPYFRSCNDPLTLGEVLYLLGSSNNHISLYYNSIAYLKEAEQVLQNYTPSANSIEDELRTQLLGVTYFTMGNTTESDQLYQVAQQYYRKAIPLLSQGDNDVYLTCAYRDIARTMAIVGGDKDSVLYFFQKAQTHAKRANNNLLMADIDAYRYQLCFPDSIAKRLQVCRLLADDYGVHTRYSEMVEIYLSQHNTIKAEHYLHKLQPLDSSYAYWYDQTYRLLYSKLLNAQGQSDSAYSLILDLYDHTLEDLQRDAGARTYAMSLHYDVEREQQRAEEAEREKRWQQNLSIVLILLLLLVLLLLFVLWRYWQRRRREQAARLQALQKKYTEQLQLALERLQQRVNLTREIELQRMRGNEVEFPKWLQTYRDEKLVMNREQLNDLIQSTDTALNGAITRLKEQYPELTEADMQFAILAIIGASDNDMSILLNVQKRTIYHRRQIVKKHIDSDIEDIDVFLRQFVLDVH